VEEVVHLLLESAPLQLTTICYHCCVWARGGLGPRGGAATDYRGSQSPIVDGTTDVEVMAAT
jgi:hypothetical protein